MLNFLLRAVISAAGLWLASRIVPGVHVDSFGTLAAAAVLLGVVNAVVRPVLIVLTFPLTLVTLGLFLLVVNAAMIWLVSAFLHGFVVHGLWAAILAAIVTGVVSWVGSGCVGGERPPAMRPEMRPEMRYERLER